MKSKINPGRLEQFGRKIELDGEELILFFDFTAVKKLNAALIEAGIPKVARSARSEEEDAIYVWAALQHYEDFKLTIDEIGDAIFDKAVDGNSVTSVFLEIETQLVYAYNRIQPKKKGAKKAKDPLAKKASKK